MRRIAAVALFQVAVLAACQTQQQKVTPLPVLQDLLPASETLADIPASLVAVFDSPVNALGISNFQLGGTCTQVPTLGQVAMDANQITASVRLWGGQCESGQQLTVSVNPSTVTVPGGGHATGTTLTRTYAFEANNPKVSLGALSGTDVNAGGNVILPITFSTKNSPPLRLTGALATSGEGVTLTTVTGQVNCTVAVSNIASTGAIITVSQCQGNGSFTMHVDAGVIADGTGKLSLTSAESPVVTVDNTAPGIATLTPLGGSVNVVPTQMQISFTEAVQSFTSAQVTVAGTCTSLPSISVGGSTTRVQNATLNLLGGACADGQALQVSVNPNQLSDFAGNVGNGNIVTEIYSVHSVGPTALLSAPSNTILNASTTSTFALSYHASSAGPTSLTGTLTKTGGGVTLTHISGNGNCAVAVNNATSSGATIVLSQCAGTGTFTVHVDAGTAVDSAGNASQVSPESVLMTVDDTLPTVTSLLPASATVNVVPTQVNVLFNEAVDAVDVNAFAFSGTCTVMPTVTSLTLDTTGTLATLFMSGATCANGQTLVVTLNQAGIADVVGNIDTSAAVSSTYTVQTGGPQVTLGSPLTTFVNQLGVTNMAIRVADSSAGPSSLTGALTSMGGGVTVTTLVGNPTCRLRVNPVAVSGGYVVLDQCTGDGTLTVSINAGVASDGTLQSATSAQSSIITVDNTSPTLASLLPKDGYVATVTAVTATFSESVQAVDPNVFALQSNCTPAPVVVSVDPNQGDSTTAVATLGNLSNCNPGQTLTVSFDPAKVFDLAGNAGQGNVAKNTYNLDPGPTVVLGAASPNALNASGTAVLSLNVNDTGVGASTFSGVLTPTGGGVILTTQSGTAACVVDVTNQGQKSARIEISGCLGDGNIMVQVAAGVATDTIGIPSAASNTQTFVVDNSGPLWVSATPPAGSVAAIPTSVVAAFSETLSSNVFSAVTVSGTCTTLPFVNNTALGSNANALVIGLSSATCTQPGQFAQLNIDTSRLSDNVGNAGNGNIALRYTYDTGPTAALRAPSRSALNQSSTATMALVYAPSPGGGPVQSTTLQTTGAGVTKTTLSGDADCQVALNNIGVLGATVQLSGCTGNGQVSLQVDANTAIDANGVSSSASAASANIIVDNVAPTLVALVPVSEDLSQTPRAFYAVFSETVAPVNVGAVSVGGSCNVTPSLSGITMNGNVATIALVGGSCSDGQQLTFGIDTTTVKDLAGNLAAGLGQQGTVNIVAAGPSVTLGAPSVAAINNFGSVTLAATVNPSTTGTTALTGVWTGGASNGVALTALAGNVACSNVSVTNIAVTGATLNISGCTGTGAITVHVNQGVATDGTNLSPMSAESAVIVVDNGSPHLLSILPASGTLASAPTTVVANFDKPVRPFTASTVSVFSSCTTVPTATNVTWNAANTVATVTLSSAVCANGQYVQVSFPTSSIADVAGNTDAGDSSAQTSVAYTITPTGPAVAFGTPSASLASSTAPVTVPITIAPSGSGATKLTSTLTAAGGGVALRILSGKPSCAVAVSAIGVSGAQLALSQCQGDGTFVATVQPGIATDGNNLSTASAQSAVIRVDNTGPTLVSLSPPSSIVSQVPTSVVATFSETVRVLNAANFVVGGTCTQLPSVASVSPATNASAFTATLSGGTCAAGQALTVNVQPSQALDQAGNAGMGNTVQMTYSLNAAGPVASLSSPSPALINATSSATLPLAYIPSPAGPTSLTGSLTATGGGVTLHTVSGTPSCTAAVNNITSSGANIVVSCSGDGVVNVTVDANTAVDPQGNLSTQSAASGNITVDSTAPTVASFTPSSGTVASLPTQITVSASEPVAALSGGNFTIGGDCAVLPVVASVSMDGSQQVATVTLAGGTCGNGNGLSVSFNANSLVDAAGNAGSNSVTTKTYTLNTVGPQVALGAPSVALLNQAGTTTLALGITPSALGNTSLTGTLTAAGGGITLTQVTGNPTCTIVASPLVLSGSQVTLSQCGGNGTLTLAVVAGIATDGSNISSASTQSATVTVDNTAPSISGITPLSGYVQALPASVVVAFSEPVQALQASNFSLSGCATSPTISAVSPNSGQGATSTLSLSGGTCTDGQSLVVSLNPNQLTDAAGNTGSGSVAQVSYAFDTSAPTVALASPSNMLLGNTGTSTVPVTFSDASPMTLTGVLTSGGSGVTLTTVSGAASCSVAVNNLSASGGNVTLTHCTGNGVLTLSVNANAVHDAVGNPSPASSQSASITVDNTAPTLVSLTPADSNGATTPTQVVATFSKAMTALTPSNFAVGGSCQVTPSGTVVQMDASNTVATLALSGATCADTQAFTVSVDPTLATDQLGNTGSGAAVTRTYAVSSSGPATSLGAPSPVYVQGGASTSVALTVTPSAAGGTVLSNGFINAGTGIVQSATGTANCTASVSGTSSTGAALGFQCTGDGNVTVSVASGVAQDALGNSSLASSSVQFTVMSTPPSIVGVMPPGGFIASVPATVIVNFSSAMTPLTAAPFSITGTCGTLPNIASVAMSNPNQATLTFSGGACATGTTFTLGLSPASVQDLAGNAGTGSALSETYEFGTGPTATLGSPSLTSLNSSATAKLALSFSQGSGAITANGNFTEFKGVTLTTLTGNATCYVSNTNITTTSAVVSVGDCLGDGNVAIQVKAGAVQDSGGAPSAASNTQVVHVDNTLPTVVSATPSSATVAGATPAHGTIHFSEPVQGTVAAFVQASGTCSTLPSAINATLSADKTTLTFDLSGAVCGDNQYIQLTGTDGTLYDSAGNEVATGLSLTYLFDAGPTAKVGAPSLRFVNQTGALTIPVTFAASSTGTALAQVNLTTTGGGLTVNQVSGSATCTVSVSNISLSGATVSLSACTGDGVLSLGVNAGAVADTLFAANMASSPSATWTVDNTAPTVVRLSPPSAVVSAPQTLVVAVFSEAVKALNAGDLQLTGTCTGITMATSVAALAGNSTAWAMPTLTCAANQTLTTTLPPAAVVDFAGNVAQGAASSNTYIQALSGPSVTLGAPSAAATNGSGSISLVATITGAANLTGTLSTSGGGVTVTTLQGTAACSKSVSGMGVGGATINLAGCSGDGLISVHVDAGVAEDGSNNLSEMSSESQVIAIDNTPPTLVSLTPVGGAVTSTPNQINARFNEAMQSIPNAAFAFAGMAGCTVPSSVAVSMSANNKTANANLTGASCVDGNTLQVTLSAASCLDLAGNAGAWGSASQAYEVDTAGPKIVLSVPAPKLLTSAGTTVITALTQPSLLGGTQLTGLLMANGGGVQLTGVNCTVNVTNVTDAGATITVSGCANDGAASLTVLSGAYQDIGGNLSVVSNTAQFSVRSAPPTFQGYVLGVNRVDLSISPLGYSTPIELTPAIVHPYALSIPEGLCGPADLVLTQVDQYTVSVEFSQSQCANQTVSLNIDMSLVESATGVFGSGTQTISPAFNIDCGQFMASSACVASGQCTWSNGVCVVPPPNTPCDQLLTENDCDQHTDHCQWIDAIGSCQPI